MSVQMPSPTAPPFPRQREAIARTLGGGKMASAPEEQAVSCASVSLTFASLGP